MHSSTFKTYQLEEKLSTWIEDLGPYYESNSALRTEVMHKLTSDYWFMQIEKKYTQHMDSISPESVIEPKIDLVPVTTVRSDFSRCRLSILDTITHCGDGNIGFGNNCDCSAESCHLAHMTSFLPSPSMYLQSYRDELRTLCDRAMSVEFGKVLLNSSIVTKRQGYPFSKVCSSAYDPKCHHPSIGKYIRYQSLMEYSVNGFRGEISPSGDKRNTFVDISFPNGWIWAAGLEECKNISRDGSWNCLFDSVTEIEGLKFKKDEKADLKLFDRIFEIRRNNTDSAAHVMMYGKIIDLMTRPSTAVKLYMQKNVVSMNKQLFNESYPAVSMHVRQGDSCNQVVSIVAEKVISVSSNTGANRKCFSVDVYMKNLHRLRDLYGVKRVYLATDSDEMIARAIQEKEYNWIFLNISRSAFQSDQYIDIRMKTDTELRRDAAFSAASDLQLLRRGDIFLGAFSGHFSKVIYYLMSGSKMKQIPFVSIDFTLDCDQLDTCDDSTVSARRHRVHDIIFWAPECIRNAIQWSPRGFEDPCGIYDD